MRDCPLARQPAAASDDLRLWRRARRTELLTRRLAVPAQQRREWNRDIEQWLAQGFSALTLKAVGIYWPYQGEFDPRATMRLLRKCGVTIALPAVAARGAPLEFREWRPGVAMSPAVLGIPVPVGTEVIRPDALLIPLVGFDAAGYRLGYGGGYFDRTLAAMSPQPLKVGVGFELSRIATIEPQWHDVPMDFIVTEAGIHWVSRAGLARVASPDTAGEIAQAIMHQRVGCAGRREDPVAGYSSPPCYAHQFEQPDDQNGR